MNKPAMIPDWVHVNYAHAVRHNVPLWLKNLQQQNWEAFCQHGLPTKQHERWKYSDFSFLQNKQFTATNCVDAEQLSSFINQHRLQRDDSILLVCVNGYFIEALSDLAKVPANIIICSINKAINQYPELIQNDWSNLHTNSDQSMSWVNLNSAMHVDGLFCYIPDQLELTIPVHVLSLVTEKNEFVVHPKNIFILGQQSKLTLIEEYFALAEQTYLFNLVNTVMLKKQAQFEHYTIQNQGSQAVHVAHTVVNQQQDSQFNRTTYSFGSHFARDDVIVNLQGANATCTAKGFYRLSADRQYIDHHIEINHLASHSNSEMLYKGIVERDARAVFNGRLYVAKDAQKTIAYQANHNLLLSHHAEVYSKPELEIYADDVKCKHGATTGQLDQEALFYLCSRGIEKADAIQLLLQGFADELMQHIKHPGIRMRIQEAM